MTERRTWRVDQLAELVAYLDDAEQTTNAIPLVEENDGSLLIHGDDFPNSVRLGDGTVKPT